MLSRGFYLALSVDMADVGSDTWCHSNIIQCEFGNAGVEFKQEGERLANTAGSAQDSDLGVLYEV